MTGIVHPELDVLHMLHRSALHPRMYAGSDGILASTATKPHLLLQATGGVLLQDAVLPHALQRGNCMMVQLLLSNGACVQASYFMVRYTLTYLPDSQHSCDLLPHSLKSEVLCNVWF